MARKGDGMPMKYKVVRQKKRVIFSEGKLMNYLVRDLIHKIDEHLCIF